jgi:hypothetical protein
MSVGVMKGTPRRFLTHFSIRIRHKCAKNCTEYCSPDTAKQVLIHRHTVLRKDAFDNKISRRLIASEANRMVETLWHNTSSVSFASFAMNLWRKW